MSLHDRLMAAANGHPSAEIPWPHRVLHDAADRITELEQFVKDSLCYCEDDDADGDAVVCDRCRLLAKKEG